MIKINHIVEYLQLFFPLIFGLILLAVSISEKAVKKMALVVSLGIFALSFGALFFFNLTYDEVFNWIIVSNQEKTFDFLLFRTRLTDLLILSTSTALLLICVRLYNFSTKNLKLVIALLFIQFSITQFTILSDSLILLFSCFELFGILLMLMFVAVGEKEVLRPVKLFMFFWGASSALIFFSILILASVLGESKGVFDVTVSSIPVLVEEITYFTHKELFLGCLLGALLVRGSIFPFHSWGLQFIKTNIFPINILYSWFYPQLIFCVFYKLITEVFRNDMARYESLVYYLIFFSCLYHAVLIIREEKIHAKIGCFIGVCNSILYLLLFSMKVDEIKYSILFLLSYTLLASGVLFSENQEEKSVKSFEGTRYSFSHIYLFLSTMFFPVSSFFISIISIYSFFLDKNNALGLISIFSFLFVLASIVPFLYQNAFVTIQNGTDKFNIFVRLPAAVISLIMLLLGLYPHIIMELIL
ncbi:MAG: hypothetical protein JNM93_09910 [Bacteriovoracaceae bacterium]|nr:hypothetical protein [Bacteriovoracaceae bacterium]